MDKILNDIELRVLGCLVEKSITTPDYYPLTLNALVTACNQKSNREPVVSFDDEVVVRGLDSLQALGLTEKLYKADSRVPKYGHFFEKSFEFKAAEVAVMCVLILRGPQTAGEIRGRTERLYRFLDLEEVEDTLNRLISRESPMVIRLPRQAGRKEQRCMHLLAGEPDMEALQRELPEEAAAVRVRAENERISVLENELAMLRGELNQLKAEFIELRKEFE
ncbi:MAG: YceH family protein [Nitrospira sp.]|nr:YceH family protein [bacterium]MBL7050139.1 YceH family protein [Nitrospira sp.]